jgi:hypothetical protein
MFRRMIAELDRLFHSDPDVRVRGGGRRSSRRFTPSLSVAGLEERLSPSGMDGGMGGMMMGDQDVTVTVTNEDASPTDPTGTPDSSDGVTTPTATNEELPLAYLTGPDKYPSS